MTQNRLSCDFIFNKISLARTCARRGCLQGKQQALGGSRSKLLAHTRARARIIHQIYRSGVTAPGEPLKGLSRRLSMLAEGPEGAFCSQGLFSPKG